MLEDRIGMRGSTRTAQVGALRVRGAADQRRSHSTGAFTIRQFVFQGIDAISPAAYQQAFRQDGWNELLQPVVEAHLGARLVGQRQGWRITNRHQQRVAGNFLRLPRIPGSVRTQSRHHDATQTSGTVGQRLHHRTTGLHLCTNSQTRTRIASQLDDCRHLHAHCHDILSQPVGVVIARKDHCPLAGQDRITCD